MALYCVGHAWRAAELGMHGSTMSYTIIDLTVLSQASLYMQYVLGLGTDL
jgi:hypothetical protein